MIGESLKHYEVVSELGAGGMGEVYLAEDTRLRRRVALKVLPPELGDDRDRLERFEREARSLAALDHPNIVTVFSVEEDRGIHFLTMAHVEGRTLADLIPAGGLPLERLLELALPLTDAVRAAHERGIVHRDLKPSNVMVDAEGRLRVLDFGLAKLLEPVNPEALSELPTEAMTRDGALIGTYPYMSPEQARGEPADARSDVFSLGVILYEMASGTRPFHGETAGSLLAAILTEEPPAVDTVRGELPHHLGRIVRRCLEKDPERRYQRAKDLLHELEDLRREVGVAEPPPSAPPSREPARSRASWPELYAAAAALVVAALAVAVYLTSLQSREPPAPNPSKIRSLAVLPLENLMNDPEQEYFVDGMTEALIATLAKIGDLRVISRTTAMQYKGVERPLPDIARELGVDALIEGSVLRAGGQVRITAQLIDGRTDSHLWAESYDRSLEDVLAVHSEVARAVADEVELALSGEQEARLAAPRVEPAAQEAYLKGTYFLNRFEGEKALEYFARAAEADPTFALPRAGRATTLVGMAAVADTPPGPLYAGAEQAALTALELDDDLAAAHQALGWVRLWSDWDWPAAERRFRRAVELEPSDPMTRWGLSNLFLVQERPEEAMAEAERARELDPLSPLMQYGVVWNLYLSRRHDEAIEAGRKVRELSPDYELADSLMAASLFAQDRLAEALSHARRIGGTAGSMIREVLDRAGGDPDFREVWRAVAERLEARSRETYVRPDEIAISWAYAGDEEGMLRWLERLVEEHGPLAVYLARYPLWDPARSDPRFQELVRRVGLPD